MPTYEYRCPTGHLFERFYRKISDASAELACPTCGQDATRVLSAGAGLLFKGSGFYLTDYGKNAHRKAGTATGGKSESVGDTATPASDNTSTSKSDAAASPAKDAGDSKARSSEPASEPKKSEKKPSNPPKSES